jgi:hypothetical protein
MRKTAIRHLIKPDALSGVRSTLRDRFEETVEAPLPSDLARLLAEIDSLKVSSISGRPLTR